MMKVATVATKWSISNTTRKAPSRARVRASAPHVNLFSTMLYLFAHILTVFLTLKRMLPLLPYSLSH